MERSGFVLLVVLCSLMGCNKSAGPSGSNGATGASAKPADALQQKLVENSGGGGTDCGRLDVHAAEAQLKTASDCAMEAAQAKRAFYVAYDMPGMSVGVAGNAQGDLFSVQAQSAGPAPELSSGACPSALRVASSGRVTCFAPGDMGSMGGGHTGTTAPGMTNPHAGSGTQPPSKKP